MSSWYFHSSPLLYSSLNLFKIHFSSLSYLSSSWFSSFLSSFSYSLICKPYYKTALDAAISEKSPEVGMELDGDADDGGITGNYVQILAVYVVSVSVLYDPNA